MSVTPNVIRVSLASSPYSLSPFLFVYYLEYHSSLLRSLPVTPEYPELPFPSLLLSCSAGFPITLMRFGVLLNCSKASSKLKQACACFSYTFAILLQYPFAYISLTIGRPIACSATILHYIYTHEVGKN